MRFMTTVLNIALLLVVIFVVLTILWIVLQGALILSGLLLTEEFHHFPKT